LGILNYSSENHTHEERVIDVNLVVQDFLKTIEVPDNANINITNKLPVLGNDFRQLFQKT
jgi:hypothetical protein